MKTLTALFAVLAFAGASASVGFGAPLSTATLTAGKSSYGKILFDGKGRALYAFTRDRRGGPSRCYGDCASAWPVYYARVALRAGSGIKQSLIGKTRRRDGRLRRLGQTRIPSPGIPVCRRKPPPAHQGQNGAPRYRVRTVRARVAIQTPRRAPGD